jgi:predicted polyphosphate/ATP-dependent NAD kinase
MASVGIIANPQAGKDARRIAADATTINNHDKVGIVRRILRALAFFGVERVVMMPDEFGIGLRAQDRVPVALDLLAMPISGSTDDSALAARLMASDVSCMISIGGDGTSRAVALGSRAVPVIPISTGTNNVFPVHVDGTIAGIAAAGLALGVVKPEEVCRQAKAIVVALDGQLEDLALVDAAITTEPFVGGRALWDGRSLQYLLLSQAQPFSLGLSSIGGVLQPVTDAEPAGLALTFGEPGQRVIAPLAPGLLHALSVARWERVPIGFRHTETAGSPGTVALDGERTREFLPGQEIAFTLSDQGPLVVSVQAALTLLAARGFLANDAEHQWSPQLTQTAVARDRRHVPGP